MENILKKLLFVLFFSINILVVFAENNEPKDETPELKYIISLDTNFTIIALKNLGFGIGVNYEQKLTDFLSIKSGLGHMVCFYDTPVVTVDLQLFSYYYPLSNGLDKLYIGFGSGCDFIMYPSNKEIPQDIAISLMPMVGWKWKMTSFLMIEPFVGGRFYIMKTENYVNVDNYLNSGFQWGMNFRLFFNNIKK
jgi:hypothetical protein